jgi:hypothetical protein
MFAEDSPPNACQFTSGNWSEERDAVTELDRRLDVAGLFKVYREVGGHYTQPRYGITPATPRIDRVLVPNERLISAGWTHGIIGVECKCSGKKLGPVVAQCQDYARAVFEIGDARFAVVCRWVFIWPLDRYFGDIASTMDQNRIGGLCGNSYALLRFKTAGVNLLEVNNNGELRIGNARQGSRIGSR